MSITLMVVRRALYSTIAISLLLVACAPSVSSPSAAARPPVSRAPPPAAEPRDQMTIDACEEKHDVAACIAGASATTDSRLAHTLLFHGCFLGSRPACRALSSMLVSLGKYPADRANAEADGALTEGCAFGMNDACAAAGSFSSGADEGVRRQEAEEAAANAKQILRDEVAKDAASARPAPPPVAPPSHPAARASARSPATHHASTHASTPAPAQTQPAASTTMARDAGLARDAERQRQLAAMQAETRSMTGCINLCVAEYSQCGTSCPANSHSPMACVNRCAQTIEPCTRACGETSQSACKQDFPEMCETFKTLTNAYRNYHYPANGSP